MIVFKKVKRKTRSLLTSLLPYRPYAKTEFTLYLSENLCKYTTFPTVSKVCKQYNVKCRRFQSKLINKVVLQSFRMGNTLAYAAIPILPMSMSLAKRIQ